MRPAKAAVTKTERNLAAKIRIYPDRARRGRRSPAAAPVPSRRRRRAARGGRTDRGSARPAGQRRRTGGAVHPVRRRSLASRFLLNRPAPPRPGGCSVSALCPSKGRFEQLTQSGLREDQVAAALAALADGRLVSVINAPAGFGKTRVLAEAARIWAEAGLSPRSATTSVAPNSRPRSVRSE